MRMVASFLACVSSPRARYCSFFRAVAAMPCIPGLRRMIAAELVDDDADSMVCDWVLESRRY